MVIELAIVLLVILVPVAVWRIHRPRRSDISPETRFPSDLSDIDSSWLERHGIEPSSPAPLERKLPAVRTVRQRREVAKRIDSVEFSVTSSWLPAPDDRRD